MHLRSRAKDLRQNMTPEEVKLWVQLRELNKQGFHFRRQAPVDGYILDFAEFTHRLIIEVDGSQHGMPEGEARDLRRDKHFNAAGFRVLRFWNIDINTAMDGVMVNILEALANSPSGASHRLPRKGGEEEK
jgi:very-short-patch-repair endonuclease